MNKQESIGWLLILGALVVPSEAVSNLDGLAFVVGAFMILFSSLRR